MYKIISYLFEDKEDKPMDNINLSVKDSLTSLLNVNIAYDILLQKPIVSIDIQIYEPLSDKFLEQAEQCSIFFFNLCGNNSYLVKPILDALEDIKKLSSSHVLFINNILFLWDKLMNDFSPMSNGPVVRPSQVFKSQESEII